MSQEAFHCEMQVYSGIDLGGTVMNRSGGRSRKHSLLMVVERLVILLGLWWGLWVVVLQGWCVC